MDDEGTRRLGVGLGDKLNAVQATDSVYGLGFRAIAEHTNLAALAQEFATEEVFSLAALRATDAVLPAVDHPVNATHERVYLLEDTEHRSLAVLSEPARAGTSVTAAVASHYLVHERVQAEQVGRSLGLLVGDAWQSGAGLVAPACAITDIQVVVTDKLGATQQTQAPCPHVAEPAPPSVLQRCRAGDVLTLISPLSAATTTLGQGMQVRVACADASFAELRFE